MGSLQPREYKLKKKLERKSSGSGLEIREYGRKGFVTLNTLHLLCTNLALTSPTSGGGSEFSLDFYYWLKGVAELLTVRFNRPEIVD
jgi:hypothetical protein